MIKKFLTVLVLGLAVFAVSCSKEEASITAGNLTFANDTGNFTFGTCTIIADGTVTIGTIGVAASPTDKTVASAAGYIKDAIEGSCKGIVASVTFTGASTDITASNTSVSITLTADSGYELPDTITKKTQTVTTGTITLS